MPPIANAPGRAVGLLNHSDDRRTRGATRGCRIQAVGVLAAVSWAIGGCPPPQQPMIRLDPIPMHEAVAVVNKNIALIEGTLRATGPVDGTFTLKDGRRRKYHVEGTLFFLAPRHFRFDMKKFGDRLFLFGSNKWDYWVYTKEDDAHYCGRYGAREEPPAGLPARPDQILDALGLTAVPDETQSGSPVRVTQRVVDDYQQLLFLRYDDAGGLIVEKEYWLDRSPPRLIRRVIHRDRLGAVELESTLDNYKPRVGGGPLLPHLISAEWSKAEAEMRFSVRNWTLVTQVGPDGIQFVTPDACAHPDSGLD